VPFLRMLLQAAVGADAPSNEQLLKVRDLTVELVDMIASELTETFWEPHKRPAQDALGARIFKMLVASKLVPRPAIAALRDHLMDLARANQDKLAKS
jgi:type I restriction enzyme R subunit